MIRRWVVSFRLDQRAAALSHRSRFIRRRRPTMGDWLPFGGTLFIVSSKVRIVSALPQLRHQGPVKTIANNQQDQRGGGDCMWRLWHDTTSRFIIHN